MSLNGGRIMRGTVALILIVLGVCFVVPTRAAETSPLKCGVNEDRVWVYDSLNSFDVAMKLKCGEPVEVIGREKGYVKIRTAGGREGFVEAKALPKPPAEENNQIAGGAQAAQPGRQSAVAAKTSASGASNASSKPVANITPETDATKPVPVPPAPAHGENRRTARVPPPELLRYRPKQIMLLRLQQAQKIKNSRKFNRLPRTHRSSRVRILPPVRPPRPLIELARQRRLCPRIAAKRNLLIRRARLILTAGTLVQNRTREKLWLFRVRRRLPNLP